MGKKLGIHVYQSQIVFQRLPSGRNEVFLIFVFVPEMRRILRRTPIQSKKTPPVDIHRPRSCPRFAFKEPHSTD